MRTLLVLLVPLVGCATNTNANTSRLEARVAQLEQQVAELSRAPAPSTRPQCLRILSRGYEATTQFDHDVTFDASKSDVRGGDAIVIDEVRGDRDHFEKGGAYRVRGRYTLASADEAELALSEMVTSYGVCTSSSGSDKMTIARGSGTFELSAALPTDGNAHVAFFVGGKGLGGVVLH